MNKTSYILTDKTTGQQLDFLSFASMTEAALHAIWTGIPNAEATPSFEEGEMPPAAANVAETCLGGTAA